MVESLPGWIGETGRTTWPWRRHRHRYCCADTNVRIGEVWMVEDIEDVSSKLDCHSFLHREVLHQREIPLEKSRSAQTVSPSVAKTLSGIAIEVWVNRKCTHVVTGGG